MQSDQSETPKFANRKNRNRSWDSICMKCYLTVTNAHNEVGLAAGESFHKGGSYTRVPIE
jgi:hypothetical protein